MSIVHTETFGRARLEMGQTYGCILVKESADDTFDMIIEDGITKRGRPVKHVGNKDYIMRIWNKMRKNKNYLNNPVTLKTMGVLK